MNGIDNKAWSKSPVVSGSLDQDSESIKTEFSNLLTCAYSAFQERIEMEEQNIMAAQV